jgi:hypothetical protein
MQALCFCSVATCTPLYSTSVYLSSSIHSVFLKLAATMAQGTDRGLNQAMQKAADTRVFTNAINAKKNKHKLGNPRVFIKRWVGMCLALEVNKKCELAASEETGCLQVLGDM